MPGGSEAGDTGERRGMDRPIEILLVEDSPGDVRLTTEFLKEAAVPNKVRVVTDGIEALRFLRSEGEYAGMPRPDLILLDLNLPRKSGREVLAEIKSDQHLRHIPVVVLTTSGAEKDVAATYDLHANCYITKPLSLQQFIAVVKSIENFWLKMVRLPPRDD